MKIKLNEYSDHVWLPEAQGSVKQCDNNGPTDFTQATNDTPRVNGIVMINLASIQIAVHDTYSPDRYKVTNEALLLNNIPIIKFPVHVNIKNLSINTSQKDSFWFRLELSRYLSDVPVIKDANTTSSYETFDGVETITCRQCHTPLANNLSQQICKRLPSEYWMELVECWICHETGDEGHGKMKTIYPTEKMFLDGATYLLLHPNVVESVKISSGIPDINWDNVIGSKWLPMVCTKCDAPLGEMDTKLTTGAEGPKHSTFATKLYKYAIDYRRTDGTVDARPEYSFLRCMTMDFTDQFSAHATYKYAICDWLNAERVYGIIWVFNPDMLIYDAKYSYNNGWKRAMKVLFIRYEDDQAAMTRHLEQWKSQNVAERLTYPTQYCNQLFSMLTDNHTNLHDSMRSTLPVGPLADFKTAYFPYL